LLLPALETLLNEGIEFHFILAGANPQDPVYEKQIHRQIESSKLANQTTITGFVGGDFKLGLLQDADLFVLPSYYENFGIAVAEAMALGTPVVISDRVQIWETVQEAAAGWIASCNLENLTEILREAVQEVRESQIRGLNARNLVLEKYTWPAIARNLISIYRKIGRGKTPISK
jgi:glycosyltransferase involved in cell wall biosynthesis